MRHRTEQVEMTARGGQLGAPPPPSPDPGQRRFDRIFVVVVVLLLVGGVGGVLGYQQLHHHKQPTPTDNPVADVRQAYLDFSNAADTDLRSLTTSTVEPYTTAAGLAQFSSIVTYDRGSGAGFVDVEDHDPQIVVYSSGVTASVDDLVVQHRTLLDPSTRQPTGTAQVQTFEDSTALVKQSGRWLVDSQVSFGMATGTPSQISYAAASKDTPLAAGVESDVSDAYLHYSSQFLQALATEDPSLLGAYETVTASTHDASGIEAAKAAGDRFGGALEHNFRIAESDIRTAYVYDTMLDDSYELLGGSNTREPPVPDVIRRIFVMVNEGDQWKVNLVVAET